MSIKPAKDPLQRNIKVDVYNRYATPAVRTSTTLNYSLCNYLFTVSKPKPMGVQRSGVEHRKLLVSFVQQWVNDNNKGATSSSLLEHYLASAIFTEGYNEAKDLYTSSNLQLDL